MSNKVPQIRFNGYSDAWVQRKLSELASVTDTKHATAPVIDVVTKYRMIRTSSVRNGFLNENKTDSVTEETYEKWSERIRLQEGDVVFSREAPIGESAVIPKSDNNFFLGQRMVGIRTNENLNPAFLNETFLAPRFRKEVNVRNAESTTVANFGIPDIKRYEINVPSIEEQEKIGKLLDGVNNLIAANQRKVDLLKELKKGFLQKMFPKNGEDKPEIRFSGFTDAWEKRKMSEMFKITRGKVLSVDKVSPFSNSEYRYPVYSSQTKNNGLVGFYNSFLFENAITWTTDGANAGTVNYRPEKFFSTNVNGVLLEKQQRPNQIIAEALNKVAYRFVSKVGNPKLMNNVMADIVISVPIDMKEQQQMSDLFSKLDNLITVNQRRVDLLKQEKKALLQKMFV